MGLCKCPKKKVTNLFCFEHRVNVCPHCLVSNHSRCIVQSYLQWLQDSDFDSSCRLCGKQLADEQAGDCVRLVCYDVFHWGCLDNYAQSLPSNTAPAGYTCPKCTACIFPPGNLVSPVVDMLHEKLSKVNWARAGLGLPLIEEVRRGGVLTEANGDVVSGGAGAQHYSGSQTDGPLSSSKAPAFSALDMQEGNVTYSRAASDGKYDPAFEARRLFQGQEDYLDTSQDHDVDKYKRRPALQWLMRWFSSRAGKQQRRDPNARFKRIVVFAFLGIIAFLTFLVILNRLGRSTADLDPMLDPMANPQIRVNQ